MMKSVVQTWKRFRNWKFQEISLSDKRHNSAQAFQLKVLKGSDEYASIRKRIFHQKGLDAKSIYNLLKKNASKYDISVFASGIIKCGELGDVEHCKKIHKLLSKCTHITRDLHLYNMLFRAFAVNECSYEYLKFLNRMVQKDGLTPDIVTASTLIGGCKARGDVELAENIWNDIISKFSLQPTGVTFAEMLFVYAKACRPNEAQKLFKDMMQVYGYQPTDKTCGALMKCYANCLDISNVLKIMDFMRIKGIALSEPHFTTLITVYLKNDLVSKALNVYNQQYMQYVEQKGVDPAQSMLVTKAVIYLALLHKEPSNKQYFEHITVDIQNELVQNYGDKSLLGAARSYMTEAHILYHSREEMVRLFPELRRKYKIDYWTTHTKTKTTVLDCHGFNYQTGKFLLYYIFTFEVDELMKSMDSNKEFEDGLLILCGRGYHTSKYGAGDLRHPDEKGIMLFIQKELSTADWLPFPLHTQLCKNDTNTLKVRSADFLRYVSWLQNKNKK